MEAEEGTTRKVYLERMERYAKMLEETAEGLYYKKDRKNVRAMAKRVRRDYLQQDVKEDEE